MAWKIDSTQSIIIASKSAVTPAGRQQNAQALGVGMRDDGKRQSEKVSLRRRRFICIWRHGGGEQQVGKGERRLTG